MTANELANCLETECWYKLITRHDIAAMLRQQQEKIEKLIEENTELQRLFDKAMEGWGKDR
jgi:hypothetical protein